MPTNRELGLPGNRSGVRDRLVRLPGDCALFPLVVRELLDLGAITLHDEDLTVGLRRPCVEGFVVNPILELVNTMRSPSGDHDAWLSSRRFTMCCGNR